MASDLTKVTIPSHMRAEWSVDPKPLATAVHSAMAQEHPIFKSPTIMNMIVSYLEVNKLETHTFVYLRPENRSETPLTLKKTVALIQSLLNRRTMIHQPYGGLGGTQLAISYEVFREFEAAVYIMTQALNNDKGESGVLAQRKFF